MITSTFKSFSKYNSGIPISTHWATRTWYFTIFWDLVIPILPSYQPVLLLTLWIRTTHSKFLHGIKVIFSNGNSIRNLRCLTGNTKHLFPFRACFSQHIYNTLFITKYSYSRKEMGESRRNKHAWNYKRILLLLKQ